jgi:hypothetical protein
MSGRNPLKEQILAALDAGSTDTEVARKLGCPAELVRAIRAAQRSRARVIADTEAKLRRTRVTGSLIEVEVAPQGVVVEDWHDREGFSKYGAPLSEGRGRPRTKSDRIRAARALARQREFQHPDGSPNVYRIAKTMGWNERSLERVLEGIGKNKY